MIVPDQNQVFDLGTEGFYWSMVMDINDNFYAAWQPVRVNAGNGVSNPNGNSGFWVNGTGLQWSECTNFSPKLERQH